MLVRVRMERGRISLNTSEKRSGMRRMQPPEQREMKKVPREKKAHIETHKRDKVNNNGN